MTRLLQEAFDQASKLTEAEQDSLAQWLLKELQSERRWTRAFAESADTLSKLADNAAEEYKAESTQELEPDKL